MTNYVINAILGPHDGYLPDLRDDEVCTAVDLLDPNGRLRFGLQGALAKIAAFGTPATPTAVDLLIVAAIVHAADTRISRWQTAQDAWTREIKIVVPVADPAVWNAAAPLLKRMLRFLTGDRWELSFRKSPPDRRPGDMASSLHGTARQFDCVSLFSGGLDSLIGAVDLLDRGRTPLFASHGGDGAVSGPQRRLFDALGKTFVRQGGLARVRLGLTIPKQLVPGVGSEDTTRGRSFLFFSLGAAAGSGFGRSFELRVPENGLISLNVPLDSTRLGSNSTRTTHPFYIHRWNELLKTLGIPATVVNPYWSKTKGEMVAECANQTVLEALSPLSSSCAHPASKRWNQGKDHCGYCLPCIIRKGALLKAPWAVKDATDYSVPDLAAQPRNTHTAEGKQVRGVQFALARLRSKPEIAKVLVYVPGRLVEDVDIVPELVSVYERGMAEVAPVVDGVVTYSSDLIRER
ncbi:MAG: hypothetical protein H2042_01730 [Rhizobiales bacterium]|nr:hypothetical protein [Hyphomicrobiales bacterium]